MTDETAQAAGNGAAPQADGPVALPMTVNAQYVKDLSFENPNAPKSLLEVKDAPGVSVNVDVHATSIGDKTYEVTLNLTASAAREEDTLFLVELVYAGIFSIGEVPDDVIRPLLLIEGPRMLFPFARAIVADATREGGFPPLLVNPIDFAELYRRRLASAAEEAGADAPQATN